MNRPAHRGSSHTPILVFAGIVGLSVIFFFIFSAGNLRPRPAAGSPVQPPAVQTAAVSPAVTPPPRPVPPEEVARTLKFNSPDAVFAEFATRLAAGDPDGALQLAASSVAAPARGMLRQLLTEFGWRVAGSSPWRDAGVITGVYRRELALEPVKSESKTPAAAVTVDAGRMAEEGWKITALYFDAALTSAITEQLKSRAGAVDTTALTVPSDALQVARQFFTHVLSHDFKSARGLTDEKKVTHEKLAGLCIVFEEGEYHIAATRPVVVTTGTDTSAWAIVKIRSDKQDLNAEVGLEMFRLEGGAWRIQAIDFNRMLESYVQASGAGKVFYSPIVKSAKGGESIVVYFEFDKAELHPRALHQLDIIASLLKSDPARKMRITGHTDDLGSDDYNQRLSANRAKNVHARLLELGVSSTQIETIGFGATAPLDPNKRADGTDNPDGRSRNRRTEIYLDF